LIAGVTPMLDITIKMLADEDGTAAMEYALIAAIISIGIIGAIAIVGQTISNNFFGPIVSGLSR
jgi:Flp pilus assembly pilin Flp